MRLFNVAVTRVKHRLYVIASHERVLAAGGGTALSHLGAMLHAGQVDLRRGAKGSYWRCYSKTCPDVGNGSSRAWTQPVVLKQAR